MIAAAFMIFPLLLAVVLSVLALAQCEAARARTSAARRRHF